MSEQLFLEAFNSEPYFFEKEEKYGAMDIIYTFEDEAGHGFKFHFEKKVALGKHAYVCVLSQKAPGLKTYKRVIGKFSNPMRTVATLLAVVRDIHDTRKDVHGIVMSIPEQAFGSYSRLVKKIMTRELRTVLNVEDGEYTPEDFEKMGLVGIVTTVKPRNMNTVYTGPALKDYQERQAGKDGAGISTPAAVVPDVKAPAAVVPDVKAPAPNSLGSIGVSLTYSSDLANLEVNGDAKHGATIKSLVKKHLSAFVNLSGIGGKFIARVDRENEQQLFVSIKSLVEELTSLGANVVQNSNVKDAIYKAKMAAAKQSDALRIAKQQPVVDPVAEKEPFYFDYDHRQITLSFNDKETAVRIKDQLLELRAATFNGNEFFTDKEKLILVDDKSLDVKKVQETLFPILGNPLMINGVFDDPNIRSSVRSPDDVIYRIKGNTIQVEDAPKDSAMTIVRELIPMADRIFDDKGSNTLELNEQGIADGFTMHNIAPVLKKSNISKRLSARLFRSWESAVTEASNKYDLSTGDLGSSFTNNSSYLIVAATSGVVGEYLRTDGNVISGIVLNTNYMIREAVAKPLRALGFTVEYDVQGWRTQVKLPVNSDYTIPGTSELAVFIKEVDNLANIARNRQIIEYVGGNKNFRAKWNPDSSRVFLTLPTAESSGLGWRDYTAYATAPENVRVDNIESYEEFLKLTEFAKNFDFGANLLRNIGFSKYLSDVRSGGAKASKSYKLKDGGEVEISFAFGDKVMITFNQASQGFDKDLSEWADEKNEIFGRISAIALYKLGTADANKTLKNIDAWLDAHIVSKEDNASSVGLTLNADFSSGNDYSASIENGALQIHDEREGVVATLSGINLDGVPPIVLSGVELHIREPEFKKSSFQGVVVDKTISVDNTKFVIKKADGTLIGRIELNSGNKTPTRKEDNASKSLDVIILTVDGTSWHIKAPDDVPASKIADAVVTYGSPGIDVLPNNEFKGSIPEGRDPSEFASKVSNFLTNNTDYAAKVVANKTLKNIDADKVEGVGSSSTSKFPYSIKIDGTMIVIHSSHKVVTQLEKKYQTLIDQFGATKVITAGVKNARNRLLIGFGSNASSDSVQMAYHHIISELGAPRVVTGPVSELTDNYNKFEIDELFQSMLKKGKPFIFAREAKTYASASPNGVVLFDADGNGRFFDTSGGSITVKKSVDWGSNKFDAEAKFKSVVSEFVSGNKDKLGMRADIFRLTFDTNSATAYNVGVSKKLDESIKEDLTGKAPNRVKRELLEATLKKLGLARESFTYGNATFKTVMSECSVEIIPTSGNIRNFAKMLGARLGVELRIDDEGFLSFDLDNI